MKRALSLLLTLACVCGTAARADRCGLTLRPRTLTEDIHVYEEGQRAIIAWDGHEETLILSTDIRSSHSVQMLEFLPLPSKPTVKEGSITAFQKVAQFIASRRPQVAYGGHRKAAAKTATRSAGEPRVEIVLHEELGPHEVTVVVPESAAGFGTWVKKFAAKRDLLVDEAALPKWDQIVRDYLQRGYRYFALDVVKLEPEQRSLTPLIYRFKTPALYFALKVSSLFEGKTVANLFILAPRRVDVAGTRSGMTAGFYGGWRADAIPVKFQVSREEVASIDPALAKTAPPSGCWLTAAHYAGENSGLKQDVVVRLNQLMGGRGPDLRPHYPRK